ncbi:MFS transporter [Pelagibacterium lentulum]|uniref:MFS transporter n=2 Tax=Pelagibacterium lentulum TaxID=2029865 RepID=A0A916R621_9HYPH|nr:MFS transporter [Pelagibacterium lentulum]
MGNNADTGTTERVSARTWAAVFSMSLGVFGLVGAEFLPASLLTSMASELGITEGMAGQAVTATAIMGMISGLTVASVTGSIDRRHVLLGFSLLLVISNVVVAGAQNIYILLLGRLLLGVALGGFWALSTALVMRMVPQDSVPKALAIVVSGVSAATIFAAPVGSYVGDIWGWRAVFAGAAVLGLITFMVQLTVLPSLPPRGRARIGTIFTLLARPGIGLAMIAVLLVFTGHMSMFTYVRPYLETVADVGVIGISSALLAFGIANFLGNYIGGFMVSRSLRLTLGIVPLAIAAMAFLLVAIGGSYLTALILIIVWGLAFGTVPVAWSTWVSRSVSDEAESGGGLLVAAINFAIATGAAVGGLILDLSGIESVFITNGIVLVLAAGTVALGVGAVRSKPAMAQS